MKTESSQSIITSQGSLGDKTTLYGPVSINYIVINLYISYDVLTTTKGRGNLETVATIKRHTNHTVMRINIMRRLYLVWYV